jgi:hypothetical protein
MDNEMRDKIAETVMENDVNLYNKSHYLQIADAIIAALPSMVKPLDMPERRNGYWGSKNGGYQVAHTNGGLFRVRLHGKVICRDIRGLTCALAWANAHNVAQVMAAFGVTE